METPVIHLKGPLEMLAWMITAVICGPQEETLCAIVNSWQILLSNCCKGKASKGSVLKTPHIQSPITTNLNSFAFPRELYNQN